MNDDDPKVKSPFVTTSQVMNTINEQLANIDKSEISKPRFELQRRFGDGTTRKATPAEAEAADMESKFQQAAVHVAKLSPQQRKKWADDQKFLGNKLYQQKEFKEAIDVYLTCLIVAQEENDRLLFLILMNNLAQCAMQVGWYKKTMVFADLALENALKTSECSMSEEECKQMVKIYFKRGKAARLRGYYQDAELNFVECTDWIGRVTDVDEATKLRPAVEKERHLLEKSVKEARCNQIRQQKGMKQILGSRSSDDASAALYTEKPIPKKRQFSTLRAPTQDPFNFEGLQHSEVDGPIQSYWEVYLSRIANVARKILSWIDNDEEMEKNA